jgi:hypothetical protein
LDAAVGVGLVRRVIGSWNNGFVVMSDIITPSCFGFFGGGYGDTVSKADKYFNGNATNCIFCGLNDQDSMLNGSVYRVAVIRTACKIDVFKSNKAALTTLDKMLDHNRHLALIIDMR